MATPTIVVFGMGAPSKFSPSILGAGVGGHAVRVAAGKGYTVRAIARNPAKYEEVFKDLPTVSIVKGDVTNTESVAECIKDATCAIFAAQAADGASAFSVDRDGLIVVAKECLKANCKLVVISSVYVTPSHNFNPLRVCFNTVVKWRMMDAKWQGEVAVREMKGLRYTIIRPGALTDKPELTNEYKIGQGDSAFFPIHSIPKLDVGKVAVAAATDPASDQVTFEIAGSTSTKPQTVEGIFSGLKKDC
jgi:uncharacterized protein YbjT (DUF2867 family)